MPHLEITELMLVHFSILNNNYQQDSRVLCTFVPNKSFVKLLDISPNNFIFTKTQSFLTLKYGFLIKILNL